MVGPTSPLSNHECDTVTKTYMFSNAVLYDSHVLRTVARIIDVLETCLAPVGVFLGAENVSIFLFVNGGLNFEPWMS